MALYESEYTQFMREQKKKYPEWSAAQLEGRALLWDKKIDWREREQFHQSSLPRHPYPYDVNFKQTS